MENIAKIISKVKKLLALSSSPNQNEAEQASVMAFELMAKHNLEMSSIEGVLDTEIKQEDLLVAGRIDKIVWVINEILDKYFYVTLVWSNSQGKSTVKIIGKKHRIEIAKHIFHFLMESIDRSWDVYRKAITTTSKKETMTRKYHYTRGFISGVKEKLEESKVRLQEEGLVLVRDQDLDDFIKRTTRLTKSTSKVSKDNFNDKLNGFTQGKATDIFSPVKSGNTVKSLA